MPTDTRFQARALRIAQLEKEQQIEDAKALKALISTSFSCEGELKNVHVPWADLDGLTWTGSKLRKATEKKERKAPYSKEKRTTVSEQKKNKEDSTIKTSTSAPALGEITNTSSIDNDQTIRAPATKIRVQLRTTIPDAFPMTPTITPPLVVREPTRSKYDSYFGRLPSKDIEKLIESREQGKRGRGRSPVKKIWEQTKRELKPEPEPELGYIGGISLSRTPSFSYRDSTGPLVVVNPDPDPEPITEAEEEDEDMDVDTPRPGMFTRESGYFPPPDPEATIRLPPKKKTRPLPLPLSLVAPGPTPVNTPASAVFPLSPRSSGTTTTTVIRTRARSNADSKPPVSLGFKRAKALSLSFGPRPMIERPPTPIPGAGVKRKRADA